MLELLHKIKEMTEAGIILNHMELFDELESHNCNKCKYFDYDEFNDDGSMECIILCVEVDDDFYCNKFIKKDN